MDKWDRPVSDWARKVRETDIPLLFREKMIVRELRDDGSLVVDVLQPDGSYREGETEVVEQVTIISKGYPDMTNEELIDRFADDMDTFGSSPDVCRDEILKRMDHG